MQGSSRGALANGQAAFDAALTTGVDASALADELFAAVSAIDSSAALRRALTDPSGESEAKRALATKIFGGKLSEQAVKLLGELAAQRWSADNDLTDSIESFGVQAVMASAEKAGRANQVESELFRFERVVAGDSALADTLSLRNSDGAGKAGVVSTLLADKAAPETVRLARQAVLAPRGRKFDQAVGRYVALASLRRDELTAVVTSAVALDEQQQSRLRASLQQTYGKSVALQTVVDPTVVGGVHVRVGDEVVDGTISRRIDEARRHVTGS